jgi:hypothetical protein
MFSENIIRMKRKLNVFLPFFAIIALIAVLYGCKKSSGGGANSNPRLQVYLTDAPADAKEVWVDIKEVRVMMGHGDEVTLNGTHPGVYDLLDLTNGKDTVLADAEIPAGTISQIRLVLGDNNYIITNSGEKIALETPSAQQSGLKVQIHQDVAGGDLYRLILDFDAGKSIVKAGNSGKYLLKPVLRVISFVPSGGSVKGVVTPDSVTTFIYAITGQDTVASTSTDASGNYLLRDISAGNYTFSYVPNDTIYKDASRNIAVTLGQTTIADTVKLELK